MTSLKNIFKAKLFSLKMLQLLRRCYYTGSREHYDQTPFLWNAYHIDQLVFVYAFSRLLYIIYHLKWATPSTLVSLQAVDPGLHFLSHMDSLIVMIMLIFVIFYFYIKKLLMAVDVRRRMWRFWRQVVVESQDIYLQCALSKEKLAKVQEKKMQTLRQKYPIFRTFLLPKWALTSTSHLLIWANCENIDKRRFNLQSRNQRPIPCQPSLSTTLKRNIVLAMIAFDKIAYGVQIFIGKKA